MTLLDRLTARDFHPDLRVASRLLPSRVVSPRTLRFVRAGVNRVPAAPDVQVERISDHVSIRLHIPASPASSDSALLWIHGGGMVMGQAKQDDKICRRFARELGIPVAAVEYRVAPEHPYPAPLDDCMQALAWLAARPDVDPSRIAVGGASAGGGLAAAVALRARDEAGVRPCFQLLIYPMLDDRTAARADQRSSVRRLWNNKANRFGWSCYLGHEPGRPDVSPYAAPARCEDFTGLPPTWIGVGTADLFHDEVLEYARQLQAADVPCHLEVVEGAFHGFEAAGLRRPVVAQWLASQTAALHAALIPS